jgi:hypothetical protein
LKFESIKISQRGVCMVWYSLGNRSELSLYIVMIKKSCLFTFGLEDGVPRFSYVILNILQVGVIHYKALLFSSEWIDNSNLSTRIRITLLFMIIFLPFCFVLIQIFSDQKQQEVLFDEMVVNWFVIGVRIIHFDENIVKYGPANLIFVCKGILFHAVLVEVNQYSLLLFC